jgi:acetyl-CoA carboxylase biotin carboxyl carrier protein
MMDLDLIERLMTMLAKSDLESLDVTEGNMRIRLSKAGHVADTDLLADHPTDIAAETGQVIVAGLTGTFFRAPAPGAAPYVQEGEEIREGQVLGLIEAMKMLNPVEAHCNGRVESILVKDADAVIPGQPLIRLSGKTLDV